MKPAMPMTESEERNARTSRPLCVDLDGTLIATDLISESALAAVKRKPWQALLLPFWLLHGQAYAKRRLAEQVAIDPAGLPYREELVRHLREEKAAGREVWLVTAADETFARGVARHLGVFTAVIASDGRVNVKGRQKLASIRSHLGALEFDYIGDSTADLPVLAAAAKASLVQPGAHLLKRARKMARIERTFGERPSRWRAIWKSLRVHQWSKNALVWIPLLLAHKAGDTQRLLWGLLAFLSFSLVASGVYVGNDLFDLEHDRRHARKRERPFASGALPLWMGAVLAPVLGVCGFALAAVLPSPRFAAALAIYLACGVAYSLLVRRMVILDVFLLAALYTLRVLAGGLAVEVPVTPWLLAFSMFLFLSLAFVKRYSELQQAPAATPLRANGRDYQGDDRELLRSMGASSGYLSVLVLALYVNSHEVISLYRRPQALWVACALLLYWVTRIWFIAHRGEMDDDPLIFTLKDPASYVVGAGIVLAILAAI
jgi:4-hydroxybenzoate polyprenyltransferase/phosphoserine phosphatase